MKNIEESSIYDVLPENFKSDEKIKTICQGIDPECGRVGNAAERPYLVGSEQIGTSDSEWLDHLAYTFNDHIWSKSWSLAQKKSWIVDSLKKKRRMGTIAGLKDIFSSRGYDITVSDCMSNPSLQPATFILSLENQEITPELFSELNYIVEQSKPVSRSHDIGQKRSGRKNIYSASWGGSVIHNFSGGKLEPRKVIEGTEILLPDSGVDYNGTYGLRHNNQWISVSADLIDTSKSFIIQDIDGNIYQSNNYITASSVDIFTPENGFPRSSWSDTTANAGSVINPYGIVLFHESANMYYLYITDEAYNSGKIAKIAHVWHSARVKTVPQPVIAGTALQFNGLSRYRGTLELTYNGAGVKIPTSVSKTKPIAVEFADGSISISSNWFTDKAGNILTAANDFTQSTWSQYSTSNRAGNNFVGGVYIVQTSSADIYIFINEGLNRKGGVSFVKNIWYNASVTWE